MRPAILITGAAKRVGRHLALAFAAHGYDIALHYHHSKNDAESAAKDIRKHGVSCELFAADLGDPESYLPLVQRAKHAFPALSALVNNASVFDAGSFLKSDAALYSKQFRINTDAPIFLTQAFAKEVGKGAVVNMLDTKILNHTHSHFFYLLSKKTLADFTRMAAAELGPKIRVNAVCPGYLLPGGGWDEEYRKRLEARLPQRRIATLDEVADAVYSLVNNKSQTGQFIYVDGGEHLL